MNKSAPIEDPRFDPLNQKSEITEEVKCKICLSKTEES